MHESPNCARNTGQEEKKHKLMHALADAAGCKMRRASALAQRRGTRLFTTRSEKSAGERPYVEKLDALSDSGLPQLTSRDDLEGLVDKGLRTRPGRCLLLNSVGLQNEPRQAGNNVNRRESRYSTPRATGQPKGSITTSRPWRAVDKHWRPFAPPIGQDSRRSHACGASLTTHVRGALRLDLARLQLHGQVSWASTKFLGLVEPLLHVSHGRDQSNSYATNVESARGLSLCVAMQAPI